MKTYQVDGRVGKSVQMPRPPGVETGHQCQCQNARCLPLHSTTLHPPVLHDNERSACLRDLRVAHRAFACGTRFCQLPEDAVVAEQVPAVTVQLRRIYVQVLVARREPANDAM